MMMLEVLVADDVYEKLERLAGFNKLSVLGMCLRALEDLACTVYKRRCSICGTVFFTRHGGQTHCCRLCVKEHQRRHKRSWWSANGKKWRAARI